MKKKSSKKRDIKKRIPKQINIEKALIENFVSMQKVLTNMTIKFDSLANQISKLLDLFETSAKTLAEKDINLNQTSTDSKEILNKVDALLDQNKTIARGMLMINSGTPQRNPIPQQGTPIPPRPNQPKSLSGYQKSISSGMKEE